MRGLKRITSVREYPIFHSVPCEPGAASWSLSVIYLVTSWTRTSMNQPNTPNKAETELPKSVTQPPTGNQTPTPAAAGGATDLLNLTLNQTVAPPPSNPLQTVASTVAQSSVYEIVPRSPLNTNIGNFDYVSTEMETDETSGQNSRKRKQKDKSPKSPQEKADNSPPAKRTVQPQTIITSEFQSLESNLQELEDICVSKKMGERLKVSLTTKISEHISIIRSNICAIRSSYEERLIGRIRSEVDKAVEQALRRQSVIQRKRDAIRTTRAPSSHATPQGNPLAQTAEPSTAPQSTANDSDNDSDFTPVGRNGKPIPKWQYSHVITANTATNNQPSNTASNNQPSNTPRVQKRKRERKKPLSPRKGILVKTTLGQKPEALKKVLYSEIKPQNIGVTVKRCIVVKEGVRIETNVEDVDKIKTAIEGKGHETANLRPSAP
ncbi:hypothetical protein WDU94_014106 [Cyamophila willieti]